MMLNMRLPTMEKRYAIAGSAIGALTPIAFATGSLTNGPGLLSWLSSVAVSPYLVSATFMSAATLGFVAACAGRRLDRANRMLAVERKGIAQLYHTAYHDALTGLGNRHALSRDFSALLNHGSDNECSGVFMLLDLDRFKYINDTLGHSAGDEVLMALTSRLRGGCGTGYRLYRLGGDEFVILCEDRQSIEAVDEFSVELAKGVFMPVHYNGYDIDTSGSLGITFIQNKDELSDVLKRADLALYHAKDEPGASHSFFTPEMDQEHKLRLTMEKDLRAGLCNGALRVVYQPIVKCGSLTPLAFSAQVCWKHPVHGDVTPEVLASLARQTDIVSLIDRWMVEAVIEDMADWPEQLPVAISLSPEEIGRPGFSNQFAEKLAAAGIDANRFVFDIDLGSLSIRLARHAHDNIAAVRALGVKVSTSEYLGGEFKFGHEMWSQVDGWRVDLARLRVSTDGNPNVEIAGILKALADALDMPVRFTGVTDEADLEFISTFDGAMAQGDYSGARMSGEHAAAFACNLNPPVKRTSHAR